MFDAKSHEWKSAKHRQQWEKALATYAYPVIGEMSVADVDLQAVLSILEPIWITKTETASRLRGRIEAVLDWAKVRAYRSADNPARWRGHLDTILSPRAKVQKVQHHKAMDIDAVPAFWQELNIRTGMSAKALQFLILTAARSGEVRGATWSEFDFDQAIWSIPAERMKAGRLHRVPLPAPVIALLNALPEFAGSSYVFTAPRGGQLFDMSLTAQMRRMQRDEVPHGFRSTFRDWAGDRTNYPRELAEQALAHVLSSKVEAAYRRADALEKRRLMLSDWADFVVGLPARRALLA